MISNWLSATLARRNIHYGWVMVGVTFLTAIVSAGAVGAPGVFIVPLQKEFGWSTAEISSALSIRFILFGLMAPFAAALMNRYGLRNVTLAALLIVASALVLSLGMHEVWQLILLWGVVVGIGTGMTALVLSATVAARWFNARRGLVVGILTASVADRAIGVPAAARKSHATGWTAHRAGADVRDAGHCGVCGVVDDARSTRRCRPATVRRRRSATLAGSRPQRRADHGGGTRDLARRLEDPRVLDPVRNLFYLRCQHQRPRPGASDPDVPRFRHSAGAGAGLLAAMGIFDFFGTIASGWLSDRYDNRYLLFWYYGLRGLSLVSLPFTDFSFYGLSLFAMFYGLDWIATVPPTVRLTTQRFGPERANRCSDGSSPATNWAPRPRRSAPVCHEPYSRPICPRSLPPVRCVSSPRY